MDMPEIMVSLSEDVPLDLVVLGGGREYHTNGKILKAPLRARVIFFNSQWASH